ncbi:DUF2057 family protein [Ferrimonas gelatinilytica]|uniref:DUF2057 domain-containing protein n=1 Tax=Ferrimonas gelatinilytica TaxID=1255257 RepID=A0ABP9S1J5_9GAMM
MKKFFATLALSTALIGLPAFAANLIIPKSVSVHSVNGERLGGQVRQLELEAGTQVLEVRYQEGFRSQGDEFEVFRSQPVYLTFDINADQQLQLSHKDVKNYLQAKDFAQAPSFVLLENGEQQALEQVNHDQMMYQFALGQH